MNTTGIIEANGGVITVFEDGSASLSNEIYEHRRFSSAAEALDFLDSPGNYPDVVPERIALNPQWGFQ